MSILKINKNVLSIFILGQNVKKVRIWQSKTVWSSHRPSASVGVKIREDYNPKNSQVRFEGQRSGFLSADFCCAYSKYRVPHLEFYIRGTISANVLREN